MGKCGPHTCYTVVWDDAHKKDGTYEQCAVLQHGTGHSNIWEGCTVFFGFPWLLRMHESLKEYQEIIQKQQVNGAGGNPVGVAYDVQYSMMLENSDYEIGMVTPAASYAVANGVLQSHKEKVIMREAYHKLAAGPLGDLTTVELALVEKYLEEKENPDSPWFQERVSWESVGGIPGDPRPSSPYIQASSMFKLYAPQDPPQMEMEELSSADDEAADERNPEVLDDGPMFRIIDKRTWITEPPIPKERWLRCRMGTPDDYEQYYDECVEAENEAIIEQDKREMRDNIRRARTLRQRLFGSRRRGAVRRRRPRGNTERTNDSDQE